MQRLCSYTLENYKMYFQNLMSSKINFSLELLFCIILLSGLPHSVEQNYTGIQERKWLKMMENTGHNLKITEFSIELKDLFSSTGEFSGD